MRLFFPAILLLTLAAHAQLARDWRSLRSPHFEIASRYEPAKIGPLLQDLEGARAAFLANFRLESHLNRPILIYIPDNPHEFEKLSPTKHAQGYYQGAPWRDLIVLRDLSNARIALLHEYTHLVLRHQGGQYPAWFHEGAAEFFATMRDGKAGYEFKPRSVVLGKGAWIPPAYMFSLEKSYALDSPDAVSRYYAQSWLYVHMLRLAPAYREKYPAFQAQLAQGVATEQALKSLYAKTLVQFDDDARAWRQSGLAAVETLKPAASPAASVTTAMLEPVDVELLQASLSSASARAQYTRLTRVATGNCEREAVLGDVAFAAGMLPQASAHYQTAIKCGVSSATLLEGMLSSLEARIHQIRPAEVEALTTLGGRGRSAFLLGAGRYFSKDYQGALDAFVEANSLPQHDQFRLHRMEYHALSELGRYDEAEAAARKLAAIAQTGDQRQTAHMATEEIARSRTRAEANAEPFHLKYLRTLSKVEGDLIHVECREAPVFHIRSGTQTVKLVIANPSGVVTGPEPGTPLEFGCGPQKRSVLVGHQSNKIRYIEFTSSKN